MGSIFYIIAGIIILIFIGLILLGLFEKPINRSKEFVLNNLKKIVEEKDDDLEFEDFVFVPIANERFEEIRKYCLKVYEKGIFSNYSEEEKTNIYSFIAELEN